jgi:uncharacterized protein YbjT (DUF2867 family)
MTMADPPETALSVLVLGADGFLGSALSARLAAAGCKVTRGGRRRSASAGIIAIDYVADDSVQVWYTRLAGMEVVINAVGIFAESGRQTFGAIHTAAPQALFAACVQARVRHVIQVSALGAETGTTEYFRSKRRADEYLMRLPLRWTIAMPSLIYGEEGRSSRLLRLLASFPLVPLPGKGQQLVQPIHVDDLCDALVAVVQGCPSPSPLLKLVGPRPVTFKDYLLSLRRQIGLPRGLCIGIPRPLLHVVAKVAAIFPRSLLRADAMTMLDQGSTADTADTASMLNHPPRDIADFIPAARARQLRVEARLGWLLPLISYALALMWLAAGVVSLWLYPRSVSLDWLAQVGVPAALQTTVLYGAAAMDIVLGVCCMIWWRKPLPWLLQIIAVLGYTAILTLHLPEFWLHPFGPLTKNVPVLAVLVMMYLQARDKWIT